MKKSTILVTGATGFIGSHLVHDLLAKSETVIASNVSGSSHHLETVRNQVQIVRADIGSFSDVLRLVQTHKPETIYHIGAMLAPACDDLPATGIQANAMGIYYILEAARLFGVRQVIFASSMNKAMIGSVNANKRHWYKGAEALARADRAWLSRIITGRESPVNFAKALSRGQQRIKVVIQFSDALSQASAA